MVWFVRKPNKRAAIVAGAVGIGLAASKFPAGLLRSPCRGAVSIGLAALVAPQGPRTSWAHLKQQARWRAPYCVWPGACPVTLRAASIGEAAFLFPSAPAPRGEQAKAADSLPKRDRKAAHRAVPVTTKEVTGIDSRV